MVAGFRAGVHFVRAVPALRVLNRKTSTVVHREAATHFAHRHQGELQGRGIDGMEQVSDEQHGA